MPEHRWSRQLLACAFSLAFAGTVSAQVKGDEQNPEAPAVAWAPDPGVMASFRREFLSQARACFLDPSGRTPPPQTGTPFPKNFVDVFAKDIADLKSLASQIAYLTLGRGPEDMSVYADMVVHVAARLGIEPPESALPKYRDRLRLRDQGLTPQQEQGFSELTEAVRAPNSQKRCLYVADIFGKPALAAGPQPQKAARPGRKRRRGRAVVTAPPEPPGPSQSVLDAIDWKRADELASAAAEGADGWNRHTRRRRRGRCYEWVRMALQKTDLWTDDYRTEVTAKGDWRRPRRAYSFAWAMNKLESRWQRDPFLGRQAPLRRLDLRVDPLVKGSIVVFDRKACGFNNRSGHIEVISSIEPLRASSYKFHEVKLDCLAKAANAGLVHIYVPQRLDPYPPQSADAATPAPATLAGPSPLAAVPIKGNPASANP
ncbi:MAG: hypothetical protein NTY77_10005 [Elusimicrobia bacterium]|nr:hypothetical protein [Elusimicrobiota bacterium]